MFELREKSNGENVLVWVERRTGPYVRGTWVEIGHEKDKSIQYFVDANRQLGLQVEKDEKGYYRALVLKD